MESGDEISSRLNSILAAEKHGLTSEELISQYKYMWGTDLRSMKNKSSDFKSMIRNLPKAPVLKDDRWFANDCEELHDMIKLVKETKSKNKAWRSSSKKKCDVCKDITKKDHNAFNTKIESKSGKLDKVLLDCKKPPSIAGCRKSQPILPEKSVQFSHSSKIGPPINLPSLEQRPSFSAKGQERLVTLINLLGGECRLNELKRQYFKQYQVALDLREIRRLSGIGDKDQRTEEELLKDFLTGRAVMDNSVNPLFTTVSDDEYYASDDDVELCDDPVDHGTLTVSRTSNIEAHLNESELNDYFPSTGVRCPPLLKKSGQPYFSSKNTADDPLDLVPLLPKYPIDSRLSSSIKTASSLSSSAPPSFSTVSAMPSFSNSHADVSSVPPPPGLLQHSIKPRFATSSKDIPPFAHPPGFPIDPPVHSAMGKTSEIAVRLSPHLSNSTNPLEKMFDMLLERRSMKYSELVDELISKGMYFDKIKAFDEFIRKYGRYVECVFTSRAVLLSLDVDSYFAP